ncbi:MAG: peptidase dimerization domain-containing protein [Pilosibacter sp.]
MRRIGEGKSGAGKAGEKPDENLEKLVPYFKKDPALDAMFHTTVVPTMLSGSAQANILPAKVTAVVNSRILTGDTVESVKKHLEDIVPDEVEVRVLKGSNASPTSLYDGAIKDLLVEISGKIYGDVIPCPEMMLGGTDRDSSTIRHRVYLLNDLRAKTIMSHANEFTEAEEWRTSTSI